MDFFFQNKRWVGALVGLLVPFVSFAVLLMFNGWLDNSGVKLPGNQSLAFDEKTIFVLAVCINLIPFGMYRKRRLDEAMAGVILPTLLYVSVYFVWYLLFPEFRLGVVQGD